MEGEPPQVGDLAQAFTGYADQVQGQFRRLERRVLALEVVIRTLVRDEVTGSELRRAVIQWAGDEIRHCIVANSSNLQAAAAFLGTMLELLPESKAEKEAPRHETLGPTAARPPLSFGG
jgi:hypothetical protein